MTIELTVPVLQPASAEYSRDHSDRALNDIYLTLVQIRDVLAGFPDILAGTGSPLGQVVANVGALYLREDGSANSTLYVKESGTDATGWVAK